MKLRTAAVRIVATAASGAVAAVFAVAAAPVAGAATPTHIGLVVAGQGTYCVPWKSGMTGFTVLSAAGLAVVVGQKQPYVGFVLGIGSVTLTDPSQKYWAYYENTGGGWSYSNSGAGGTHPGAGSVEGWVQSPTSGATAVPPAVSYAALCGALDAPAPPAPPAPPPTAPAAPVISPSVAHPTANPGGPVNPGATTVRSSIADPTGPLSPTVAAQSGGVDASETTTGTNSAASSASGPSEASSVGSPAGGSSGSASLAAGARHRSSGSALPAVFGALIVLALAGAGGFAVWRRRQTDSP